MSILEEKHVARVLLDRSFRVSSLLETLDALTVSLDTTRIPQGTTRNIFQRVYMIIGLFFLQKRYQKSARNALLTHIPALEPLCARLVLLAPLITLRAQHVNPPQIHHPHVHLLPQHRPCQVDYYLNAVLDKGCLQEGMETVMTA
jgi:hypothetical protein